MTTYFDNNDTLLDGDWKTDLIMTSVLSHFLMAGPSAYIHLDAAGLLGWEIPFLSLFHNVVAMLDCLPLLIICIWDLELMHCCSITIVVTILLARKIGIAMWFNKKNWHHCQNIKNYMLGRRLSF